MKLFFIHLNWISWFLEDNSIDVVGWFIVLFNALFMLQYKATYCVTF